MFRIKLFYALYIVFGIIFSSELVSAKILLSKPASQEWLPPMDGWSTFEISGKAQGLPEGTELVLNIDKQRTDKPKSWSSRLKKDGTFAFQVNQQLIYPDKKTVLTVEARVGNSVVDKVTQEIYCCSAGKYGFYHEFKKSNSEQKIIVSKPGTDIDGIRLIIPSNIKVSEQPRVVITVQQGNVIDIPSDRYIPINSQVYIDFFGFESTEGIEYSLRAQPQIPRDTLAIAISQSDWEHIYGRDWKIFNLAKEEVVILGHNENKQIWQEIIPQKVEGSNIQFTLPKGQTFNRLLPAVKNRQSDK